MDAHEARNILSQVSYVRHDVWWGFEVHDDYYGGAFYLQVQFYEDGGWQKGRKWRLSKWMTKSELVLTAWKAVLTAEEHEAREHFWYRGRKILQPHVDVEALWEVAERYDARQHEEDKTA